MKFTAVGDMIIQKPIYPGYEGFGALADFIKQGDARFFNLETPNGRVALIAVNTSFEPSAMAGVQSPRVPGRPGINGMRVESYIELPQEDMEYIKQLAKDTNINAEKEITPNADGTLSCTWQDTE